MNYQRRDFLKDATKLGCGLALAGISQDLIGCSATNVKENGKPFGLQLYTLRDEMPKDPKGVLKQVASYGYKQIESYEGDKGIFWGMTHTDFKKYMDDLGMQIVSSHCNMDKDFEQKAAQAAEIGMKYLLCPHLGAQKALDDYKRAAEKFNNRGEICKKAGIRFGYHNHDYSFIPFEGQFPQDIMMQNTDANLVDYEMDIYWVVTAGQNPVEWLNKYPARFKLLHIKDRKKGASPSDKDASANVGTGGIDFKNIVKTAKQNGINYYIVEQERYDNTTPLAAAKEDADYMKKLLL
jgi:sugar phosphate isomerase/epimerase